MCNMTPGFFFRGAHFCSLFIFNFLKKMLILVYIKYIHRSTNQKISLDTTETETNDKCCGSSLVTHNNKKWGFEYTIFLFTPLID